MKLALWQLVISLRDDIGRILERTMMPSAQAPGERTVIAQLDSSSIDQLRTELRNRLDALRDALHKELTESEAYLVMFPLVLLCDEMVMSRLPKQQHTEWHLLQHELFQINFGGDVFYDFIDERFSKPDTPILVFEVLFFCLSAGFVGKFGLDGGKVKRYKSLLAQRIPGALRPLRRKRKRLRETEERQEAAEPEPAPPPVQNVLATRGLGWFYAATFAALLLAVFGVVLFSNL